MGIKRKAHHVENYYTYKKYDSPEPNYENTDYRTISDFYSNYEFSVRLAHKINKSLKKKIGNTRGTRVLEELKSGRIKIINEKTFLQYSTVSTDIGSRAWRYVKGKILKSEQVWQYMSEVTRLITQRLDKGEDRIDLSSVFFYLAVVYRQLKEKRIYYQEMMEALCGSLAGAVVSYRSNPFVINLFQRSDALKIADKLYINLKSSANYTFVVNTFLKCLKYIGESHRTFSYLPEINLIVPLKKNPRVNQYKYLMHTFGLTGREVNEVFNDVTLSVKNNKLIAAIAKAKNMKGREQVNVYGVIKKLIDIEYRTPIQTYSSVMFDIRSTFLDYFDKNLLMELKYNLKYYYDEGLYEAFIRHHAAVEIDCTKIMSLETLKPLMGAAAEILLTQVRHAMLSNSSVFNSDNAQLVIFLQNLNDTKLELVKGIKNFEKHLVSKYNKPFKIILNFQEEAARSPYGNGTPEYVRVISDIHTDINDSQNYVYDFKNDFVINAGDTSGDVFTTRDWIRTFMTQGVSVTGNHLGYTDLGEKAIARTDNGKKFNLQPKNGQQQYLVNNFSLTRTPVLSNNVYKYEKMFIIGTTLYTDFKLFGEDNQAACMIEAAKGLNDFKYCSYYNAETNQIEPFTVETHAHLFNVCVGYIRNRIAQFRRSLNSGWGVVVVTHHAPTPYSIAPQYKNDPLSAAFASDLRWLLDEYPEIRLWVHGHCVDDQTEVLTTEGWKNFGKIKQSDTLLNLNTNTNKIEEDKINFIVSNTYSGKVYHFKSRGNDIRVTANHDMLIFNKENQQYKKIAASELYTKLQKVLVRAGIQERKGLELSDDLLRLLVWISADGNKPYKHTKLIRIRLYKERKIKRLKELLTRLNIQYREYIYNNKAHSINFELPDELEGYSFKPIDRKIAECNQHQCSVVIEEYAHTDGTHNSNSVIIFTSKKEEADTIQLMCITNGYGCSIQTRRGHGFKLQSGKEKISYDLNICSKPYRCLDKPKNTTTIEEVQNEHFWCLNTNNGTLIIRRNGKVNITGNCHNPCDYVYKECRVVCEPFGYYNENHFDVDNYGKRIKISDITSRKRWKNILRYQIDTGKIPYYED